MEIDAKIRRINEQKAQLKARYDDAQALFDAEKDTDEAIKKHGLAQQIAGLDLALGILHTPDGDLDESEPSPEEGGEKMISIGNIFGHDNQKAYVEIFISASGMIRPAQLEPATARKIAGDLFASAEAAEGEAFVMDFFKQSLDVDDQRVLAAVLIKFREWRNQAEWAEDAGNDPGDPPTYEGANDGQTSVDN